MSSGVVALYEQSLAKRGFLADPAQWRAVERLQRLFEEWSAYKARRDSALKRLLVKPPLPKGVYLWGAAGRGKSFLMDAFYRCVPLVRKRRVHFHHFMREIHRELESLKGTEDPLAAAAARTARRYRLICFDEFHVADIADAMILGRYLREVMERGVQFVMTSNYSPDRLYPDGLQRARFMPAIKLLKEHTQVVHVDSKTDYRLRLLERAAIWFDMRDPDTATALQRLFEAVAGEPGAADATLTLNHRRMHARRHSGDVIWFTFKELCDGPRGQADYIEIARCYHTVFISDVPVLGPQGEDQARRFITLVDEFYDRGVKLIISAERPVTELYRGSKLTFEFERTQSRLIEMQSQEYLARPHQA